MKNPLENILNDKNKHDGDLTDNRVKLLDENNKILPVYAVKWTLTYLHVKTMSPMLFTPN